MPSPFIPTCTQAKADTAGPHLIGEAADHVLPPVGVEEQPTAGHRGLREVTVKDPIARAEDAARPQGEEPIESSSVGQTCRRLRVEFPGTDPSEIFTLAEHCRLELSGVPDEAVPELLERLVRARLLDSAGTDRP
ncbi:hypothetical protein [Pseudonocardia parietis]|uniref:Uncharacterized protein n=1 Tax=Pseudonocardia parietis TaxID=570936 RepID=A0ABS4W771_9PSEU|nr:hypothetical protein [Pseudonocardia parietis]MBP2372058.1 hypothetical protein [Pseudonocardia parietis]